MRKRTWIILLTAILIMGLGTAGAAMAGKAMTPDEAIAVAKAKSLAIDKARAQKLKEICDRYAAEKQQRDMEKRMAAQAAAVAQADDGVVPAGKGFRRALTIGVGFIPSLVGAGINGFGAGVTSPTDSPLEYLLLGVPSFCRGVNTSFVQMAEFSVMSGYDTVNYGYVFDKTNRANPAQLGYVAEEVITWGPLAQVLLTGGAATAPACAAAGVLAPASGMCYGGTVATLATTNTAGAFLVGKGVNMAEKKFVK